MRAGDITKYDFIQHPGAKFPVADSGDSSHSRSELGHQWAINVVHEPLRRIWTAIISGASTYWSEVGTNCHACIS
jgi:hypothetical protein